MKKIKRKIAGFSLIEVIFAMAFMTVILLGTLNLMTGNLRQSRTQELRLQAHRWADQGLRIVEEIGYTAVQSECPASCEKILAQNAGAYSLSGTEEILDGIFRRTVSLAPLGIDPVTRTLKSPSDAPTATEATVIVNWEDASGPHDVQKQWIVY